MGLEKITLANGETRVVNTETFSGVDQTREADLLHGLTLGLLGDGPQSTITTTTGDKLVVSGTPDQVLDSIKK